MSSVGFGFDIPAGKDKKRERTFVPNKRPVESNTLTDKLSWQCHPLGRGSSLKEPRPFRKEDAKSQGSPGIDFCRASGGWG
ncbi:hypothetical protein ACRE_057740 [Hapsidospora chrysogenum ATCC 11550]|uniref:Uncharacterized protein n=1 Tax=Hapsidospora chrysogenum (strain ATCC 11550 / CBS 779.69 / DSM 880 / IAM 14645 / JCM 23072 / IMI 49137) TaxID=857340 RepID=A0A086T2A0_HAPC1|nr:hypothetical protein ACRE_057740 [Hapsidospora chrysogenum ATCC 11550]